MDLQLSYIPPTCNRKAVQRLGSILNFFYLVWTILERQQPINSDKEYCLCSISLHFIPPCHGVWFCPWLITGHVTFWLTLPETHQWHSGQSTQPCTKLLLLKTMVQHFIVWLSKAWWFHDFFVFLQKSFKQAYTQCSHITRLSWGYFESVLQCSLDTVLNKEQSQQTSLWH